jgi:hypothetical protein
MVRGPPANATRPAAHGDPEEGPNPKAGLPPNRLTRLYCWEGATIRLMCHS